MIGARIIIKRGRREDGERPFWISFADMMTALMVLFLLVMSVALLAVTKKVSDAERDQIQRQQQIEKLLKDVEEAATRYPGISVDLQTHVVDFGPKARFDFGKSLLTSDQAAFLRAFVPEILNIARNPLGQKWFKQIVVEGFTDRRGSYLYNLNLSLQRSQRVLCVLLARPNAGERAMTPEELQQIRKLFLVGGYSFNSTKNSDDASRRIELRLDFRAGNEKPVATGVGLASDTGDCEIPS